MKNFKGFITGAIVMFLFMTLANTVFAAQTSRTLTAIYRDIKITINGNQIEPKDASGNPVEPFIVGGTTYLPVRSVAEAVGYDVSWDNDTSTVILNKKADIILVILNNSTKVYHLRENCVSARQIIDRNREEIRVYDISEISGEYSPCGICAE